MANVQKENGHTQIANELLEAMYIVPLSDYEHRVLMFILRKTYGFKKKSDWISQKQIAKELGVYKSHISRTIKKLKAKNMIINSVEKNKKILGIQKDYEQWKLPIQVTKKLTNIGNKYRDLKKKLPIQVTEVTHTGNQKLPIQAHTKETITKEDNTTAQSSKELQAKVSINFNFETKKWEDINEEDKTMWNEAYPACDIDLGLKQMAVWLVANPKKKKKNYRRFITNWFTRWQERGGDIKSAKYKQDISKKYKTI